MRTTTPCPHGTSPGACPCCAEDLHDAWTADRLARLDAETIESWRRDAEEWAGSGDSLRAEYGDLVPAGGPGAMP